MITAEDMERFMELREPVYSYDDLDAGVPHAGTHYFTPKKEYPIIGIVGDKGSGKSEVKKVLVEEFSFVDEPFAATLKAMLSCIPGIPRECIYGDDRAKMRPLEMLGGKTSRYAQQTIGTEWGRDLFGQDFWVRIWKYRLDGKRANVVADDVRFVEEMDAVLALGGKLIKIVRPWWGNLERYDSHRSEALAKAWYGADFHHVIVNNGTVDELRAKVREAMASF